MLLFELDGFHPLYKLSLERGSVGAVVCSTVAIRAKRDNRLWIVWTSITQTLDMVRLKVWLAIVSEEWRRLLLILADTLGTGQDVMRPVRG